MKKIHPLIFIVEDDKAFAVMIKKYLFLKGIRNIEIYNSGEECLENLPRQPKIIIQDHDLTGINGLDVLKKAKEFNSDIKFVFLSGQHSLKIAVDIMKHGASDYVIKDDAAKDYIFYKIKNMVHVVRLEHKQKTDKQVKILFLVVLIVSWLLMVLMYFLQNH